VIPAPAKTAADFFVDDASPESTNSFRLRKLLRRITSASVNRRRSSSAVLPVPPSTRDWTTPNFRWRLATAVAYGTNELLMDKYFLMQLGYIRELAKCRRCWEVGVLLGLYEAAQVYGGPHHGNKASGLPTDGGCRTGGQYHFPDR